MSPYYVYIMSNRARTIYVGVTNDLERRVIEHKDKLVHGFTARYNFTRLVYYESSSEIEAAIAREKQMKGWVRKKKVALIESVNPRWQDLSALWSGTRIETLRSAQGDREKAQGNKKGGQTDRKIAYVVESLEGAHDRTP